MRVRRRSLWLGASVATVAALAVGCSSSGSKTGTGTGTTNPSGGGNSELCANCAATTGLQISNPNSSGTPVTGGTLTVLGTSDVDNNLDPNIGYYTLDYLSSLLYNRPLYAYPSNPGKTFTAVPDIATGEPVITNNGLNYAVTIQTGAMWNTTPPRQVTAADVVRGVKRSCNPTDPFGGQPDFNTVLKGYQTFCTGFAKVSATSATAQAAYINGNDISGVQVDPSNPQTVDFTLTQAAPYFTGVLNLPPFNPAPAELLNYLPDSTELATHQPSDGPYQIKSYTPNTSIVFTRNLAWQASSDPVDKAYVNEIDVSETGNQQGVQQQILTNSAPDVQWDIGAVPSSIPTLLQNPDFQLQTESATNPYVIWNTVSTNNNSALKNATVRQALSYAINRSELIQNGGGPDVDAPLTHLIAPGTDGSGPNFDPYPYNPAKAKQLLATVPGASNLTLTLLYRNQSASSVKDFQTLQANFQAIGVTLKGLTASNADFYGKYLVPGTAAKASQFDLALAGWGPDWYPSGGPSYFLPILSTNSEPPNGSNYGFFSDPTLDNMMTSALTAPSETAAALDWHNADVEAMSQAAIYPIADPNSASLHSSQVHNAVFIGPYQNENYANVWISNS